MLTNADKMKGIATLTIRHRRRFYEPKMPHLLFVDGLYAGTMRGDEYSIRMPSGRYRLRVQFGGVVPLGKSGRTVDLSVSSEKEGIEVTGDKLVEFHDREWLWNLLFDVDLVVWVVSLFVPLTRVYKIISDAFFLVWIVRLVIIRKRYYRINEIGIDN